MVPPASNELLTLAEVARRLKVSRRTVWRWVALGALPEPIRFNHKCCRWSAADLEQCVARRREQGGRPGPC